jgi:hypothetical protein
MPALPSARTVRMSQPCGWLKVEGKWPLSMMNSSGKVK